MVIGSLGDVVFEVSDSTALTIENIRWSSSAKWETHARHLKDPALEYTGMDEDRMEFDVVLSRYLGVDVMERILTLFEYERNGTPVPLTIGSKGYGKYRWVIRSTERTFNVTGPNGPEKVTVHLSLAGYTR